MTLGDKLIQLCGTDGEIQIESIHLQEKRAYVLLPYETSAIAIELEGDDDQQMMDSFRTGINWTLGQMADHLENCKLT